jgi:hypothetical protein
MKRNEFSQAFKLRRTNVGGYYCLTVASISVLASSSHLRFFRQVGAEQHHWAAKGPFVYSGRGKPGRSDCRH